MTETLHPEARMMSWLRRSTVSPPRPILTARSNASYGKCVMPFITSPEAHASAGDVEITMPRTGVMILVAWYM